MWSIYYHFPILSQLLSQHPALQHKDAHEYENTANGIAKCSPWENAAWPGGGDKIKQ